MRPRPPSQPPGLHGYRSVGAENIEFCDICDIVHFPESAERDEFWLLPDSGLTRFEPACWFVVEHRTPSKAPICPWCNGTTVRKVVVSPMTNPSMNKNNLVLSPLMPWVGWKCAEDCRAVEIGLDEDVNTQTRALIMDREMAKIRAKLEPTR